MSCIRSLTVPPIPSILLSDDMIGQCLGVRNSVPMSNSDIASWWNHNQCQHALYDVVFPGLGSFSSSGYQTIQEGMTYMLYRYYSTTKPALPGQDGYTPVQDIIADVCSGRTQNDLQGICDPALSQLCSQCGRNETSQFDPILRLCGCYVPLPDPTIFGPVPRQCDSLCDKFQYVATLRDPDNLSQLLKCDAGTVCVVDQVSISASKSQTGGASINQVCPGCSNVGECRCVIDLDTSAQIGLTSSFELEQYCGSNSTCLRIDPSTGIATTVECTSLNAADSISYPTDIPNSVWTSAIVITLLILILYLAVSKR